MAFDHDRLIAYLIGDMMVDDQRGRSGRVRGPGCAYDFDAGAEPVCDLYAAQGAKWVNDGVFSHFALIPTSDAALIQAWSLISFGVDVRRAGDCAGLVGYGGRQTGRSMSCNSIH